MMAILQLAMAIVHVTVETTTTGHLPGVMGVGQGESFENPELSLDQVRPGTLGGSPDGPDVQLWE
jgi:hypothetical protein